MNYASRSTLIEPRESIDFSPGTEIDGFIIDSLMLEGSQATLFHVQDRASVSYVLRVYFDGCSPQKELTDSLLENSDEKLCHILKIGTYSGHKYDIVPELINLPDIRWMTERDQSELIKAEADAISAFHETGFCHLDIKKEHFMRNAAGRVNLIDIASAKKIGSPAPEKLSHFLPRNAYSGTVRPENDLFSFGISILEQFLPDLLADKTRPQIKEYVLSGDELQDAVNLIPDVFQEDVKLLLSDDPEVRNECVWFRPHVERIAITQNRRERQYDLAQIINDVKYELLSVAVCCSPEVFNTTVKRAASHTDFQSADALRAFLVFLQDIPKASGQVNYTTLTLDNVLQAWTSEVVTETTRLSKTDPIKTLHEFERKKVLYIFDRQLINRLDEQGAVMSEQREKRAFAALKIIGIVLGIIAGLVIAIAVIIAVIYILMYLIAIIVIVGIVCALISSS